MPTMTNLPTDLAALNGLDLAGIDLAAITAPELAAWLRDHGPAQLSPIERIELAEKLTRRRFITGAAGLTLSACGAPSASAPTATVAATTRMVEHSMGTIEIPVKPQRIVTLSFFELGWPLAQMGVTPIGNSGLPEQIERLRVLDPDSAALLEKADLVGFGNEDLEKIAALKPDLIIGFGPDPEVYENMAKIAPTVLIDIVKARDIVAAQRALAELVGVETGPNSPFGQRLARYEERIQALKAAHPDRWSNLEWTRFNDYINEIYIVDIHPIYRRQSLDRSRRAAVKTSQRFPSLMPNELAPKR
ncbi:MAG: hypothetical protein HC828_14110 [Blastochloris sp.]|nr:hypothetical protein [Blastochloris sp.]